MQNRSFFKLDKTTISEYWNERIVYFSGNRDFPGSLPDIADLISRVNGSFENEKWNAPIRADINASRVNADLSHDQHLSVSPSAAQKLYSEGFSLCFGDLSPEISSIKALKDLVSPIFGHEDLIKITAYLSPPAAIGVLHYDRQHNYFIQKEGSKKWYVSEGPAIANPYENLVYPGVNSDFLREMKARGYNIRLPKECGQAVFELHPGDILYIPPGHYHSPETLVKPSLHYTLTLEPACFWKDFQKALYLELLNRNKDLFMDYRFLTSDQKNILIESCRRHIFDLL
jgi:hypothetical protein